MIENISSSADNISNRFIKERITVKKFITGFVAGALLFSAIPAFAGSVKSIVGARVSGVYTVKQEGQKIAEGAIINGSAYVPVRAMAEATDTPLKVQGKVITLGEPNLADLNVEELNFQKSVVQTEIDKLERGIHSYETDHMVRAKDRLEASRGTDEEPERQRFYDGLVKLNETYKTDLASAKAKLAEIESKIAELQK